jgi:hypothetical protein
VIAVEITYLQPAWLWAGVRGPAVGILPLPAPALALPFTDPEGRFRLTALAPPAALKAPRNGGRFVKGPPAAKYAIAIPPTPPVAGGPVLLPLALVEIILAALPQHGSGEVASPDDPARAALVKYFEVHKASTRGLPAGVNSSEEVASAVLRCNQELARMLALDDAPATGVAPWGTIRDQILEEVALEEKQRLDDAKRLADAIRQRTEKIDVDLARAGLVEITTRDRRFPLNGREDSTGRLLARSQGIPIGEGCTVHVSYRDHGLGRVAIATLTLRDHGIAQATRKEIADAGDLAEGILLALRDQRMSGPIAPALVATPLDARTPEGRHAVQAYEGRVGALVKAASTAPRYVAAYIWHLVFTLPVAFGGQVALANCIDLTQEALRLHVTHGPKRTVLAYDQAGRRKASVPDAPLAWPEGFPHPDAVGSMIRAELARGSCWRAGEAYETPSLADLQRIRLVMDPHLFERAVRAFLEGKDTVASAEVYEHLHATGLIDAPTPGPSDRARVSAILGAGYVRAEIDRAGTRARVWRRKVAAT